MLNKTPSSQTFLCLRFPILKMGLTLSHTPESYLKEGTFVKDIDQASGRQAVPNLFLDIISFQSSQR